jgi:uncharacterized repeat protein (TIGR03803 family)
MTPSKFAPRITLSAFKWLLCAALLPAGSVQAASSDFDYTFRPWEAILAQDGNYYGSTEGGGSQIGGTLYRLTPSGKLRNVANFRHVNGLRTSIFSGTNPTGGVTVGPDGGIYGSTLTGGVFSDGVIFKRERDGRVLTLHHYAGGNGPKVAPVFLDGDLYAATSNPNKAAYVLRLSRDGSSTKKIPSPSGYTSGLVATSSGKLLLATYSDPFTTGIIWQLNAQDEFEVLADMGSYAHSLVALPDGGVIGCGPNRIFHLAANGMVTTLHTFPYEGPDPVSLTLAPDGSYVGSASAYDPVRKGEAFRIDTTPLEYAALKALPFDEQGTAGRIWVEEMLPYQIPAAGTNRPPCAKDDFVAVTALKSAGGLPEVKIAVLKNDSDADKDALAVTQVGAPGHGTAAIAPDGRGITYVAAAEVVENDSFSYVVADGQGGTAEGHVFIRTNSAGRYSGPISFAGNPRDIAGTLTVKIGTGRACTGKIDFTGAGETYSFNGSFNDVNQCAKQLAYDPRTGRILAIQLTRRPAGAKWSVDAEILHGDRFYFNATCALLP